MYRSRRLLGGHGDVWGVGSRVPDYELMRSPVLTYSQALV